MKASTVRTLTAATIPADWAKRCVLHRVNQKGFAPERFAFYALPDGQVACVQFHPMNGWDDLFCAIGSREWAADRRAELLAGERFEHRESKGYGRIDVRAGRYNRAQQVWAAA